MSAHASPAANAPAISQKALVAMAVAAGMAVANIYYNQPMLGIIEAEFGHQPIAGFIPTATQLGFAAGLFLLVPLGDLVERRRLIVTQFLVLSAALVLAAIAPSATLLMAASLLVGACSTVAQQIVPFAAALSAPERRGRTIGTVMAGILSGILLSRTVSGFVGQHLGWRTMFWLSVPMALGAAGLMQLSLPRQAATLKMPYGKALASLVQIWQAHPALRVSTLVQAALFGSFTCFWTILALYLAGPAFHLGADVAGLFGVVGAVGVFAAPVAGRIADRRGPNIVILMGATLAVLSWLLFGLWASIPGLILGVILFDFGVQSVMVSNQHIVYALDPAARNRLNTIYMTGMFLGGSVGSALATFAWDHSGWPGVSLLGAGLGLVALGVKIASRPVLAPPRHQPSQG